jgi:hypothetical protein
MQRPRPWPVTKGKRSEPPWHFAARNGVGLKQEDNNRLFDKPPGSAPVAEVATSEPVLIPGDYIRDALKDVSLSKIRRVCAAHNWTMTWDQATDVVSIWSEGLTQVETIRVIAMATRLNQ